MDKNILTIAGFDPSGCAGVAADLKTFQAWGVYGVAVITAITAQNTQRVSRVYPVSTDLIQAQFESILSDIEIHAVKIGLLTESTILELVVSLCKRFQLTNIVVDPVLRSTTGFDFANPAIVTAYKEKLFPASDIITPNLDEASVFAEMEVKDVVSMKEASIRLHRYGAKNVVITGGHLENEAVDVWYDGTRHEIFVAPKVMAQSRGLGCTFSSILAVHLARNMELSTAIPAAKDYIARAMAHPFKIGRGRGPLNHNIT
ncbi:bifunctional hydroxymethylpyrimidine kinase/phosphomethylpyrimidine kinase [bacterium]|nr:bifunctional hydroxymethylpyrimidine kinase/phosphomethylpyrimidine kinase [bacterium]MCI0603258.1 bifunctional hydroxymethylpyrimidine kinase/phosphomethylpyrimidine kinase [bacterium]